MHTKIKILVVVIGLGFVACSPKIEEVVLVPDPAPKPAPIVEERLTSCTTLDDLSGSLKIKTEDAFTLYRDQFKFEKYEKARDLWKQAFYSAPGANGRVTYHFRDGVQIYTNLFQYAAEPLKQGMVDTILAIYAKQMECFPDDGTTRASRAFDAFYQLRGYVSDDLIFEDFSSVLNSKGDKADYFIINPFARLLYDRVLEEKVSVEEARPLAHQILSTVNYGLANCKDKSCESWDIINEYTPDLLSGLEGIRGFYDCEYYMGKYYSQYEANPNDCDNVTEVYYKMVWAGCDPKDPRVVALREAKEKECYVAPPPPGPLKLAYAALEEGEFKTAITYLEEYIENTTDPLQKADKSLTIAKIYYAHIKNFPEARRYALRAAENRSNWGEPYILIGKLYASSGPLCGPGRGWDSQIVTWPAVDKFEQARRIDPSVAAEANKLIATYTRYMPSREDIFSRQISKGTSFRVGCWIQENTTVRTAD